MRICPLCKRKYQSVEIGFCAEDGQPLIEKANQIAQSQQPDIAGQTAIPFSASLAMTFFAHRFIENVPPENYGVLSFCQPNVKVTAWQLVTELPMIAFWYLRENNCLRFTPTVKTGFFKNSPTLVIEANPAGQVSFPGLEYDFWEIIKRSPGITVETVFTQFLGGRNFEPEDNLVKRLIDWMIQLGYGQPDTSPKPFFRMSSSVQMFEKFAPDCRRIAAHEQAAQIIHQRWMKFRAEEPDVFYYLFDDVVDAALNRIGNNKRHFASHYWKADSMRRSGKP